MYLTVMIIACIANALVTTVSFLLYVRTRLTIRERMPEHTDQEHAQKLALLDRREQRYQTLHFITLALFVLFGVLLLVHLSARLNPPTITRAGKTGAPANGAALRDYFFISVVVC